MNGQGAKKVLRTDKISQNDFAVLMARLMPRDQDFIGALGIVGVMSHAQARKWFYAQSESLNRLAHPPIDVVINIRRSEDRLAGRSDSYYILSERGRRLAAALDSGVVPPVPPLAVVSSIHLQHHLAVGDFFLALRASVRELDWVSEQRMRSALAKRTRSLSSSRREAIPDGAFTAALGISVLRAHVEVDRSTEEHSVIARKLEAHGRSLECPDVLLFCFTGAKREEHLQETLSQARIVIASTTMAMHVKDALGAIWKRPGDEQRWPLEHFARRESA